MKLPVLMWKLAISRYKRYFQTSLELLVYVLIFIVLFRLIGVLQLLGSDPTGEKTVIQPEEMSFEGLNSPQQIVYYPQTALTDSLMNLVAGKIGLNRINTLPAPTKRGLYGSNDMSEVNRYLDVMENKVAAFVIFQDAFDQVLPSKLNYTIRIKSQQFNVHTYFVNNLFVSYRNLGLLYERFMKIQWAVDTSYIALRSGTSVTKDLTVQEFVAVDGANAGELDFVNILTNFTTLFIILSLSLTFMFHVGRIVEDRISGVQALLSMSGVSSFMLNTSHFFNAFVAGILYSIIGIICYMVKGEESMTLIRHSNPFLIWLMLLLYYCSVIMFGFGAAFALPNNNQVVSTACLVYVVTTFGLFWRPQSSFFLFISGLLPHCPMSWFWRHLFTLEKIGTGLTFKTLFDKNDTMNMTPFYSYVMICVQTIVYALLGLYVSLIRPGKYVSPRPWTFLCTKNFWKKSVTPDVEVAEMTEPLHQRSQYYEQQPPSSQIGIQVVDVTKMYNNNRVLNKLSLNVYKGEITVLLGHNGAGKTTILSIIAGMNQATTGKVLVNGLDTAVQSDKVINSIGVCPQENMFFNDLSVVQHIMFFTMLRQSVSYLEAKKSSLALLNQLGLYEKRNSKVTELSGGMMRRVQLGCALAGDSRILILDEPTSGLDVETRRELWDLLLTLRGERTVLLTTHFMEEADVLGDRVAALHGGELRCHASPDYLKKAVGEGYLLNLITLGVPKTNEITDVVQSEVPEAVFKEATLNSVTFVLPPEATSKFPKMFQKLEDNRDQLSINSIGVGTATLEEVFLTLCSDVDTQFSKDTVDEVQQDVEYKQFTGIKLYLIQLQALFMRQMRYIRAHKLSLLFGKILFPLGLLGLMFYLSGRHQTTDIKTSASMDLSIYDAMPFKKILLNIEDPDLKRLEPKFTSGHERMQFVDTKNITNVTIHTSMENRDEYKKYLFGLKINEKKAQVLYSTSVRHAAPVGLNMLTNMLAGEPGTIYTYNEPVFTVNQTLDMKQKTTKVKTSEEVLNLMLALGLIFALCMATDCQPLTKELTSGTRHIFIMYGCSSTLYWIFVWLYNVVLATLAFIIPTIVMIVIFEGDNIVDEPNFVGSLFLLLLVGALPIYAFCFLLTMRYKESMYLVLVSIFAIIFIFICPLILYTQKLLNSKNMYYDMLVFFDHFVPFFTFANGLVDAGSVAVKNAECYVNRNDICKKMKFLPENIAKCCSSTGNLHCYFCFDKEGLGKRYLLLTMQAVFYMVLVLLTQFGIFSTLWGKIRSIRFKPPGASSVDPLAIEEINYVNNAMNLPPSKMRDALLVQNLYKVYPNIYKKNKEAVRGVTLSVKKGECFGLVGVNGAGKTSMFNMLVGASHITRGAVLCRGHRGSTIPGKYMRELGFCPQHHSLDDFQTGQENLAMLLKFRGFRTDDIRKEVNFWINLVSLQRHRHKAMAAYSGGCKRRLAAAAALMSGGALTVLDEPTTGVDVSARRALWMALRGGLRGNRAVVVSSHSMEEIEALCGRVCILVAGQVRALAAPAELRRLHATGHSLHFNLTPDESVATEERVNKLKEDVQQTFDCTLKDAHKSMLHYRIATTLQYSDLFTAVEQLKARHSPLLADYTVKQPTLEDVFLAFAREGQAQQEQANGDAGKHTPANV